MKIQRSISTVLISLFTLLGVASIAQQDGMGAMGGMQMPTPEQMEEMMKQGMEMIFGQIDADGDDSVSLEEYTKMQDMFGGRRTPEGAEAETDEEKATRLKTEFEGADEDDDDVLSKEELVAFMVNEMKKELGMDDADDEEEDSDDDESTEDNEESEDDD